MDIGPLSSLVLINAANMEHLSELRVLNDGPCLFVFIAMDSSVLMHCQIQVIVAKRHIRHMRLSQIRCIYYSLTESVDDPHTEAEQKIIVRIPIYIFLENVIELAKVRAEAEAKFQKQVEEDAKKLKNKEDTDNALLEAAKREKMEGSSWLTAVPWC